MHTGQNDLWDLVEGMTGSSAGISGDGKILNLTRVVQGHYAKIQKLETASPFAFLGTSLAKKEDRLAECAKMYLSLGNFKAYCETMISLSIFHIMHTYS